MKVALVGINAKYIHPNLAIRLLKKNTAYPTDILEFTIKDEIDSIYNKIIGYDVIAFSCYIWNIEIIKMLIKKIENKIIVLGGPEVSYNAKYYLDMGVRYVIKNEGEEAFDMLLSYLDNKCNLNDIPNLYHKDGFTYDKLVDLDKIKMAYDLLDDVENKIVYLETSRGCPYKCAYCMASLDNKLRFFNINEIKETILVLNQKGARIFKFLDRTFNANKKNFIDLIDFIIKNHKEDNSFQFEITGDLLSDEIIDYINTNAPRNLFRFEIGIQSTNVEANLAVGRIQNNEKLFSNINRIQSKGIIDLHLDLIAGLPYEDYNSFINTFNEVVALRPLELQLGFLKLLCGTRLFDEKDSYGYIYQNHAPYEIIKNNYLSEEDIKNIHICEDAFEKYYNNSIYRRSIQIILDNIDNPFMFFHNLGVYNIDKATKRLEDSFKALDDYLKYININNYKTIHKSLIIDYLSYFNLKPKAWWDERVDSKTKKQKLRKIFEAYITPYTLEDLFKYSMLVDLGYQCILAIYKENEKNIIIIGEN